MSITIESWYGSLAGNHQSTGETRLLLAIMDDAMRLWFNRREAVGHRRKDDRRDAVNWLLSERGGLFSSNYVLEHLGIDPVAFRERLQAGQVMPLPRQSHVAQEMAIGV